MIPEAVAGLVGGVMGLIVGFGFGIAVTLTWVVDKRRDRGF